MKNLMLPLIALSVLSACSPEAAKIEGRREVAPSPRPAPPVPPPAPAQAPKPVHAPVAPDVIKWITLDGGQSQLDFNPKVDILFVIDNSDSMKSAQENLSRNINHFVEAFQKNRMINYHIGVVSVWDSSERFKTQKKDGYALGELRRLKNASGQSLQGRYVSRFQGATEILAATLKIGIAPFAQGGPETEEVFSPLSAALKSAPQEAATKDFFREDAQLVTVVITDADDSTPGVSPEQMAQELFDFKKGNRAKVSAYGALVRKSDPDNKKDWGLRIHPNYHPECFDMTVRPPKNNSLCKEGFGPDRLEQFILAANADQGTPAEIRAGHIMSLVQPNFGKDLAKIGSDISVRTLAKEIQLPHRPRQNDDGTLMIRVRYGAPALLAQGKGQLIPQKQKGGWLYDAGNNSVKLSGDIEYQYQEGARFAVDMVPLAMPK